MNDALAVVTRPVAQATGLMRRIQSSGRQVVCFPLLEILPAQDPVRLQSVLCEVKRYALVVFVSPNAVDAALAVRPDWPAQVPLAVVGEGSRTALERYGLDDARCTIYRPRDRKQSDSESLLAELDLPALHGQEVLIVRAQTGRELLADTLRRAGAKVTLLAAYRCVAPELTVDKREILLRLLAARNDWIVTSSQSLYVLQNMVKPLGLVPQESMRQQRLIVPHERIARVARSLGFAHITQTQFSDAHLCAALQSRS